MAQVQVQQGQGEDAAQGAAHLHCLGGAAVAEAAADIVDYLV